MCIYICVYVCYIYIYMCIVYFYVNVKRYLMILLFYYELQNTSKIKIKYLII